MALGSKTKSGIFAAALMLSAITLSRAGTDDTAPPDPTKEAKSNTLRFPPGDELYF
jgi:hypothetical protein